MIRDLFRPFSYLTISHSSHKPAVVNWLFPLAGTVLLVSAIYLVSPKNIFGTYGLLDKLLTFIQSLPGFYIAALAAIASLNNPSMTEIMEGESPTINISHNEGSDRVALTLRRFLCSMFAYLTALCILLSLAAIFIISLAPDLKNIIQPSPFLTGLRFSTISLYLFFLVQLFTITAWGIFYLGDKMHTPRQSAE